MGTFEPWPNKVCGSWLCYCWYNIWVIPEEQLPANLQCSGTTPVITKMIHKALSLENTLACTVPCFFGKLLLF